MAMNKDLVTGLYVAIYDRAPDQEGRDGWLSALDAGTYNATTMAAAFIEAAPAKFSELYDGKTNEEVVQAAYNNILGRDGEDAGVANWTAFLDANGQDAFFASFVESALDYDPANDTASDDATKAAATTAQQALTNKVEAGNYFADTLGAKSNGAIDSDIYNQSVSLLDGVTDDAATVAAAKATVDQLNVDTPDPGAGEGTTFTLTASTDRLDGTDLDDTFEAYLSQNQMIGGVSNTLSSADKLDGGAGIDTLNAELVTEFYGAHGDNSIDIQARTSNIENVTFEARDIDAANAQGDGIVTVDAKNMTDIVEIGSRFSDGDLVIENLTTLTSGGVVRSTDSITITMDHTDNASGDADASDLTVTFDEDYLVPTTNLGESSVVFKIMNQDSYDQNDGDMRLDGVYVARMEFSLDGTNYDLAPYIEENAQGLGDEFKTEAELVAHLNEVALPALAAANPSAAAAINSLTFSIGGKWNDNNQNRIGDEIVLTASNAHTLETRDAWLTIDQAEQVDPGYASNRIERTGEQVGQDSEELAVNVELHKVGREGQGGNLVVGGESQDGVWDGEKYTGEGKGIDIFNISVLGNDKKPSNLGTIASTNNDLDIINIKTDAAYVSGDTHASLTIRNGFVDTTTGARLELDAVNANDFKGDLTIGSDIDVLNLNTLNAAGGGNVEFHADVTADGKYDYNTGAGDDTINLDIDTDATDRVDTALDVDTANGNDSVMLYTEVTAATGSGHASQNTMELFKNMNVSTAAGNDTIVIGGDGRYNIDAGANDDFVYVNSQVMTGTDSETDAAIAGTTGTWAFGRESDSVAKDFADKVLYQATLTVTFAGLESTVTVATDADGNFVADQVIINNAIEAAIEQSPELKQLLEVTRGDGDQLMTVTSTVDGDNDLSVSVNQPNVVATNAATGEVEVGSGDVLDLVEGLMSTGVAGIDSNSTAANIATVMGAEAVVVEAANNGGSSNATGASNVNYSVIDMGSGNNDLVVFDSNEASSNVLVVDQTFGKTTVLNFHDADGSVGEHAIDFTHYLSDQVDASANNNSLSATDVNVTLNNNANGANFASNSVNMIVNLAEDTAEGETFANLTADNLLQALNGDTAYANIGESNPTATANLVGTTQNHVVMVENPNNAGEYKVFHLTSNLTTNGATTGANGDADSDNADFATAVQLGTLDFGASINFNLVGNDTYTAERATLVNAADGDDTVVIPDATYAVSASAANVDEGNTVTFTLDTTGVDAGTTVDYSLSGVGINAADLVDGSQLSGSFTVEADGSTDVTVTLAADATTEGTETMTISVAGQTASVDVNDTSTGGNNGGGDKVDTSIDVGTAAAATTIDAATGALNFTDDAAVETNVVLQNFTSDDQISVSNAAAGDYSFTSNGSDYIITFNNGGTLNSITLEGATGADGLVFDEASFEAAIGFDAFLLV